MNPRKTEYPIAGLFTDRRSSRAIADRPLEKEKLMSLFEAARWAPSAYNSQPWRYVYACKGSQAWQDLQNLLTPQNRIWTTRAPVVVVLISRTLYTYNDQPSRDHAFSTGSAWENFALQATIMGLVSHAMEGFDDDAVRTYLKIPPEYAIAAMAVTGYPGSVDELPQELQKGDREWTDRMPVDQFVFEDEFTAS